MSNTTQTLMRCLAAAVGLALPLAAAAAGESPGAEAASFDLRLTQQLREFQNRAQQPEWVNPWLTGLRTSVPEPVPASADRRLNALVARHTRAALDRGGWSNPWVVGPAYAAGEPLLAVAVGGGATTLGEPHGAPVRVAAAR